MNEVLIKTMRQVNIFSVFLTGLALAFLLGISLWYHSLLKTIYMFDELTGQTYNNKEAILVDFGYGWNQNFEHSMVTRISKPKEIITALDSYL